MITATIIHNNRNIVKSKCKIIVKVFNFMNFASKDMSQNLNKYSSTIKPIFTKKNISICDYVIRIGMLS